MDPRSIAQAYILLGDAHVNHEYKIQEHYYSVASAIARYINDTEILEKSYFALGNIVRGGLKRIDSIVWYFKAFQIHNSEYIRAIAKKRTKEFTSLLRPGGMLSTLNAHQIAAINEFSPTVYPRAEP